MIDCLSNPNWISPQIDFLLFLQQYRVGILEHFDKFFLSITTFGEYWFPSLLAAIVYWCIDFRAGIYLFSLEGINALLSHLLKMIACVYRPWVLDSRINPSELAVPYAKGYSFPSGHSSMSSSVIGGLAYLLRKHKVICTLLIGLVLLIGFSRMWLGVHTPQDVIGGFSIGLILIFAINKIINLAEQNKKIYWYFLGIINVLTVLSLIYVCYFNTYRMDYINGELLVDPKQSIYLTFVIFGYGLGLINGCFLCRLLCPFEIKDIPIKTRVLRGVIGGLGIFVLLKLAFNYIIMNTFPMRYAILGTFLIGITITLFYPLIFTCVEKILKLDKN